MRSDRRTTPTKQRKRERSGKAPHKAIEEKIIERTPANDGLTTKGQRRTTNHKDTRKARTLLRPNSRTQYERIDSDQRLYQKIASAIKATVTIQSTMSLLRFFPSPIGEVNHTEKMCQVSPRGIPVSPPVHHHDSKSRGPCARFPGRLPKFQPTWRKSAPSAGFRMLPPSIPQHSLPQMCKQIALHSAAAPLTHRFTPSHLVSRLPLPRQ